MQEDDEKMIAAHAANIQKPAPHQVRRWHDAIDEAAALERGRDTQDRGRGSRVMWLWGTAVTAALVAGVVIGMQMSDTPGTKIAPRMVNDHQPGNANLVAFTRGLSLHLRESQQRISEFDSHSDTAKLIRDIVEQNRRFETVAEQNDAANVARLLRAFEPILLQLAATDIAPDDAAALRAQLAFELNVVLTKLSQQPSERVTNSSQSL